MHRDNLILQEKKKAEELLSQTSDEALVSDLIKAADAEEGGENLPVEE